MLDVTEPGLWASLQVTFNIQNWSSFQLIFMSEKLLSTRQQPALRFEY